MWVKLGPVLLYVTGMLVSSIAVAALGAARFWPYWKTGALALLVGMAWLAVCQLFGSM